MINSTTSNFQSQSGCLKLEKKISVVSNLSKVKEMYGVLLYFNSDNSLYKGKTKWVINDLTNGSENEVIQINQ